MSNLIIGNKYVPINKSFWGGLDSSSCWKSAKKKNQPYLYYAGLSGEKHFTETVHTFTQHEDLSSGDYFFESDVIPYEEEFVLPLEWCIKVTVENVFDISKWRGDSYLIRCGDFTGYLHSNKVWANNVGKSIEISYEQFKTYVFKITNMLPKRWFIERNEKNYKVVNKWAEDQKLTTANYNASTGYIYSEPVNNKIHRLSCTDDYNLLEHNLFTEINFEQFQEFVLKIKTNNMKQIGWKLKKEYENVKSAVNAIVEVTNFNFNEFEKNASNFSLAIQDLKRANVLELWFEPVYEEKIKVEAGVWYVKEWNSDNNNNFDIFLIDKVEEDDYYMSVYYRDGQFLETYPIYKRSLSEMVEDSRHLLRKATFEEIGIAKSYKELKIAGYKAEKVKDGIKFGCQTIPMHVLDALENLMERDAFTATLKIQDTEITLDIIKKLKNL